MNVYRALDRRRLQFDFAVAKPGAGDYDDEIRSLGGRIFIHPTPSTAGVLAYRSAFRATLATAGPFAGVHSHVHHFTGVVLQVASQAGIARRMAHSHSVADGQDRSLLRFAYRSTMRRLIAKHATHLFGCSPEACEALYGPNCWRDPRVQVVPNAIPLATFRLPATNRQSLRRQLSLPELTPVIGHVGSFTKAKNHQFLIDVFAALHRRRPDARLILVGDGPLRPEVEGLVRSRGLDHAVRFLGTRTDIPDLMGALDILVMPSLWEGFPVVAVEAQAAGLPCLISDAVTPTADLGLGLVRFTPLGMDPETWADEATSLLQIPRPTRERCCAVLATAGYNASDVCARLTAAYADQPVASRRRYESRAS